MLVACPENSLLDAKEFLRPIVTPYELEVALQPTQTWTGRYVLDFEQLLKEQKDGVDGMSLSSYCSCIPSHREHAQTRVQSLQSLRNTMTSTSLSSRSSPESTATRSDMGTQSGLRQTRLAIPQQSFSAIKTTRSRRWMTARRRISCSHALSRGSRLASARTRRVSSSRAAAGSREDTGTTIEIEMIRVNRT